jgi:hypothetical protein
LVHGSLNKIKQILVSFCSMAALAARAAQTA